MKAALKDVPVKKFTLPKLPITSDPAATDAAAPTDGTGTDVSPSPTASTSGDAAQPVA